MRVSEALAKLPGVERAAAVMATPLNLELLAADGILPNGHAAPQDLLVVVEGEETAADRALMQLDELLSPRVAAPREEGPLHLVETAPANLAVIAVPGQYAAAEAYATLRGGMHVFLFSDNVSIDDEVALKRLAAERELLMMGPDCGTSIVNGVGLGFANRVSRGPVGIVGASGTGIQQVCCLLDHAGIGVAQAIGTGGRDLSRAVAGSMTTRSLRMLEADDQVEVLCLISKPADANVARTLHQQLAGLSRSVVACLLGETLPDEGSVRYADTLTEAARLIGNTLGRPEGVEEPPTALPGGAALRIEGLYSGGTLCSEAERILHRMGAPHHLVDLGDDEYTRGRAHPIIDPRLRVTMLMELAEVGERIVVLLDVILGDLADPSPATSLLPALRALKARGIPIVIALVGTRRDPQGLKRQQTAFEKMGCVVRFSNADAARIAGSLVTG